MRILAVGAVAAGCLATAASASATSTVCASGCPYKGINEAITALPSGSFITVGAGEYFENIVVNKEAKIKGAGATTIVYPAVSKPECEGGSLCGGEASDIILVEANNVTIANMTLNGNNPHITSGVVRGEQDIDARNGIITDHLVGSFSNLTVSRVKV